MKDKNRKYATLYIVHHLSQEANKDFDESDMESYSMYLQSIVII